MWSHAFDNAHGLVARQQSFPWNLLSSLKRLDADRC
jgi:hypothetical protein